MNLGFEKGNKKEYNSFIEKFIKELSDMINKIKEEEKKMVEIILTPEQELEFTRKEFDFLHSFFEKELSKNEIYIVTDKYENDEELHRYKITQYKDNMQFKYVTFEKDLPENVQLNDVVRKVDGKFIHDEQATQYIKESLESIKLNIAQKK